MVEITSDMKNATAIRMAKIEEEIDRNIRKAAEKGENRCYFPCDKDRDIDVYDEIRSKYERAGYKIKPTGYIGGVYQKTEHIYW